MAKDRQFAYRGKARRCFACQAAGHAAKQFTAGPHDPAGITYAIETAAGSSAPSPSAAGDQVSQGATAVASDAPEPAL